jgi:dihydroorotate dehydrogenase electron transfer subunit
MIFQIDGTIINNRKVKSSYFLLEIHCPQIAEKMKPGQFVMLKVSAVDYPLLRRPFSIYKLSPSFSTKRKEMGYISILYKKVGKGTQMMTDLIEGQKINLIGPLGNGFTLPAPPLSGNVILIGGGVGVVSLCTLAEALSKERLFVFIGGKTRGDIVCAGDFRKLNSHIFLATEDGSLGFKGTVIDLFLSQREKLGGGKPPHYLYSCGPTDMLRELARKVDPESFISQVSLEARMACGFGACWGCVIKTRDPQIPYQRVCKEGPVFNLRDIVWEE